MRRTLTAGLVFLSLLASQSWAAKAQDAMHILVDDPETGWATPAASLSRFRVSDAAVSDPTDTFLVSSSSFQTLTGACDPRGWKGEDLSSRVFAHVDNQFLVHDAFIEMGTHALWFGTDAASAPDEVAKWVNPVGYGNRWSQRLTSPAFSRVAHPAAVLSFDASLSLSGQFNLGTVNGHFLNSGETGQEFLGVQGLLASGSWAHMYGRWSMPNGSGSWLTTPPIYATNWLNGVSTFSLPNQIAVDDSGNVYVADTNNDQIQKFDRYGGNFIRWGNTGSGPGDFNHPVGVSVDASFNVYVTDSGNNRVESFTTMGVFQFSFGTSGSGPGQLSNPAGIVAEPGGTLLVVDRANDRVERFTTAGGFVAAFGATGSAPGSFSQPLGIARAANGDFYVADTGNDRIERFDVTGAFQNAWGGHGSAPGQFDVPTAVAVDRDGSVFVSDYQNNRLQKFDATGNYLVWWALTGVPALVNNRPQGLAIGRHGDFYVSGASNRIAHLVQAGPINGFSEVHYEVHLGQDGNEDLALAEPLQLRVVFQTNQSLSPEDGNLSSGDTGINLVDNITVSDGGGNILAPLDFEDGTTGAWTLSARNGFLAGNLRQPSFIRDVPTPGTIPLVQSGVDPNLPSCLWTFFGPDGYLAPGTMASLTSPWIALDRSDSSKIAVTYNAKLNAFDQKFFLGYRMRGKNAGDTHARMVAPGAFFVFGGSGNSDLLVGVEQDLFAMPDAFNPSTIVGSRLVDSVQFVFEISDQVERLAGNPVTRSRTHFPILDNLQIWLTKVDTDHDGVRDSRDACPTVNAAGQDADGDGCPDPGATLKHVESWPIASRPIHFALSQPGAPGIGDGSDLAALRAAFATWQAAAGASIPLVEDPVTSQTDAVAGDAVHLLTFHDDYQFPANVLAITPTLSYTRRLPFDDAIVLPGQIVDADIMFNPAARFRTATAGPATGSFDLQSVATHEIGHFLGLSHTGVVDATMFPVLQAGTQAATLQEDDAAAIASAYPSATFTTAYGAISGVVTDGTSGTPVPGAMVFAVLLDGGGALVDTVSSDYTDENGAYSLRRLSPGSYAVRVVPLDGSIPGVVPEAINAEVAAIAHTNFQAEWYGGPESNHDDPTVRDPVAVNAGATHGGIDVVTNVDLVPPTVVDVSPPAAQSGVVIDTPVLVTFSEPVASGTLSTAFRLHKVGDTGRIGGSGQLLPQGISFVFEPSSPLAFSTDYQVDLTTALTDRAGNALASTFTSTFRTQDPPPVSISDIEPRQAPAGALVTVSGAGYDPTPGTENRVVFSTASGSDYALGTLVTPTSIVVQVPADAASGPVKVVLGAQESNPFGLELLTSQVLAPSPDGAPIALPFAPTDVALAPDGGAVYAVGGDAFARISLDASRPPLRTPLTTAIAGAERMALTPNGLHAWVTSPADGVVSEVDTDPHSGSYGQAVTLSIGGEPQGIAIAPAGQRAYVTDRASGTILVLGVDPAGSGYRSLLGTITVPAALLDGGIAIDPRGRTLYVGSEDQGLLAIDLSVSPAVSTVLDPTPVSGAIAVTPAGSRLLAEPGTTSGGRLLYRDLPSGTSSGQVTLGGEPRDLAVSPTGGTAYVANTLYARLQVVDVTQAAPVQVASVSTDPGPVAVAVSASGSRVAVANGSGRSISLYVNAPASVAPLRLQPTVAFAGDRLAIQVTGGPPAAGSSAEFDGVARALDHPTAAAADAIVPVLSQRDGSVAVASGGTHSLALPLRIVDAIAAVSPRTTGVAIAPQPFDCGAGPVVGALPVARISPDGSLLAVGRQAPGGCVKVDLYRISSTQGASRYGDHLIDAATWAPSGSIQDMAFTPDGRRLWAATDAGGLVEIDVDPSSPGFRSAVPFGASAGVVRAITADPFGRWMLVGAEPAPSTFQLQMWTTARAMARAVGVSARLHALAVTPDGRYAVAGAEARAFLVDLDAGTVAATTPVHVLLPPDAVLSVAVTGDGRRALGLFPGSRIAVWNTDPDAGTAGAELYFGAPVTGPHLSALAPAPNPTDLLAACADGATLLQLSPGLIGAPGDPLPVATRTLGQPARALAESPDGRQLWVANWDDGTLLGDLRLFSLSTASQVAIVSGRDQAVPVGGVLPLPVQVQVIDASGNPQAGALVRFELANAGQGSLETPGALRIDRLADVNGEASVTWIAPASPAALSLVVSVPGSGASTTVAATATGDIASTPPVVVETGPANGATDINARSSLFVRFSQPMDSASVSDHLQLSVAGIPEGGHLAFADGGRTVFFTPIAPLSYSASCVLTIGSGALAVAGQALAGDVTSTFSVESPPVLTIASVSPPSGPAGVKVTLTGKGFDPIAVLNTVRMGSTPVPIVSATATSIVTTISADAAAGDLAITVQTGSSTSDVGHFEVLPPKPDPLTLSTQALTRAGVQAISITPDGTRAYISVPSTNAVLAFDLQRRSLIRSIPVGLRPQAIAILPDGSRAYVANTGSNDLSVIDVDPASPTYNRALQGPGLPIKVGVGPVSLVASGIGPQVLVLNSGDATLSFVDADPGDATFNRVTSTAGAGSGGHQVAITPDGTRCYVASDEGILMIDLRSRAVTTVAGSGTGGKQVAISPDGTLLFALMNDGRLLIVDIAPGSSTFNRVVSTAGAGTGGKQIAVSPDGTLLYVAFHDANTIVIFRIVTGASGGGSGSGVAPGAAASLVSAATVSVGQGPEGVALTPTGSLGVVANAGDGTVSLLDGGGSLVAPQAPASCITPSTPCVSMPVTIQRDTDAPLKSFRIGVRLSGGLTLCGAAIAEGSYLSAAGATDFHVTDLGGGLYTVEDSLFGAVCGATQPVGTLFTVGLSGSAASATGSVAITDVTLSGCANAPLAGRTGDAATISIDGAVPSAIAALSTHLAPSGSSSDGTIPMTVQWPAPEAGAQVLVYRAPFGHYPGYDDGGSAAPAAPAYPPGTPWTRVATVTDGSSSLTDLPPSRDQWFYVAYVRDGCGNTSPVSNLTSGTIDYLLGDFSNGFATCAGDNRVDIADVSFLGSHYGATLGAGDPLACLDIGPTTTHGVDGRPLTDREINFEDLILLAINFGRNPSVAPAAAPVAITGDTDRVEIDAPAHMRAGDVVVATVRLHGGGAAHAVSLRLGWSDGALEPAGWESGGYFESRGGVVMSPGPGSLDGAVLGARAPGLAGDGSFATFRFRALRDGDPGLAIRFVAARNAANASLPVVEGGVHGPALPAVTRLLPPRPNPFGAALEIGFSLARPGPIDLAVFAVDGRRVRTLARGAREAGEYRLSWDGRDERGEPAATGVYYVRLTAPGARFVHKAVRVQ